MEQKLYYTKYAVSLTLLLKQSPTALLILLYVLWRRGVETKHEDGKWHFHVGDIAKHLGKDEKTIRKHLKPLLDLGTTSSMKKSTASTSPLTRTR